MSAQAGEPKVSAQALREGESKYRFLFENLMEGFAYHKILFDEHGKPVDYIYLEVNDAFEKMTGLKKENILGRTLTEVIPGIERDKAGWIEIYGRVTLTGEPVRFENYSETLKRWFTVTAYSPGPPYFATVFEDITERKNAEEALRESEKRLRESEEKARNLIAHAPTPIYEVDIAATRFLSVNDTVCELSGYSREELLARSPMDMVDEPSKVFFRDRIRKVVAGEEVKEGVEYNVIAKDGRKLIMEVRNVSFSYRNGKPDSVLVVAHDITERKQKEVTLKADLAALTRMHTLSGRLLEQGGLQPLLEEVMESAVAIMGAEKGTLQLFEKDSLRIVAHHGHQQPFLDFFSAAENVASVCGEATRRGERVIVPDVESSSLFVGTPSLEVLREAGVRAVQSTPMISRTGTLVGILTTQWGVPYTPNEHDLWRVDLLVRQAVELIEYSRAEEELRVSEARRKVAEAVEAERKRLYDVLETLPAMVCLMTPDYHVTFANRSFREKFGDSGGRHCYEYCFGRAQPCEFCESYKVLRTGKPHDWEVTAPDGLGIFDVYDFPFTDVDGSPLILEMDIDITERKRAEEALRDASRYTRNLIEASLDPLVTISAEGKIMDVNRATEQITGISRDQIIGTDFSDYFTEPEKAREGYQEVFREGFVKDYPLAIRHKAGKVTDVLYHATIYRDEAGAVQGLFAAARDVTERKQAEEELRRQENQIRFFASQCLSAQETERRRIAAELHDSIASSLAGIKFKIERMAQDIKQPLGSAELLLDLSSNVAQSLGEVRRIMADLRPSVLDDLGIMAAINWFCREYQKTYPHVTVEKQVGTEEHDVPDSLKTPIFRIAQEAMNNVAKHSKATLVNLLLQKEGERILLSVQDNGQGFDPEKVKKGMGLSNIRERAELSGGASELQSTIGKGTTVRVWWPIQVGNVA